jgi:hypothetical protein
MLNNDSGKRLENIIRGNVIEGQSDTLTTTRNYLCQGFATNTRIEKNFDHQSAIKEKQKEYLNDFISHHNLWHPDAIENNYLTEGGEAKIYLGADDNTVLKFNDAIYYSNWLDFLNSVLIHNIFFCETLYDLKGFVQKDKTLYAVMEQPFISKDKPTDISDIKKFLDYNGFESIRRYDYYNKELGLILEDIHDENVLTNANVLFFIDTVFYIHLND